MTSRLRLLIVALAALLLGLLAAPGLAAAVQATPAHAYTYDPAVHIAPSPDVAHERGPPATSKPASLQAVRLGSYGTSGRAGDVVARAYAGYDQSISLPQVNGPTGVTEGSSRAIDDEAEVPPRSGVAADGGSAFFRGVRGAEPPSFSPRPNEFKVDPDTGFVRDTHGVSVFDNPQSVAGKGFTPHKIDQSTVPDELRIIQRGQDPHHFEIVPRPGANLTPERFAACLSRVACQCL